MAELKCPAVFVFSFEKKPLIGGLPVGVKMELGDSLSGLPISILPALNRGFGVSVSVSRCRRCRSREGREE